jgi:hypothetical protein
LSVFIVIADSAADVPRLEQHDGQASALEPGMQPLRQRARLQADPLEDEPEIAKKRHQRLRRAQHLDLTHEPTLAIHNTHAALFQRHVDPGKIPHGCPSAMLGPTRSDPVVTITVRDSRYRANARRRRARRYRI